MREVYLRSVARYDHLGVHSHASEEHFELGGRGVLCLIENDDGVAQSASAHEGKGCYLNYVLLHHLTELLCGNHVLECIVEGLQIGVDLLFHVAWKETEFLSGLHCGT